MTYTAGKRKKLVRRDKSTVYYVPQPTLPVRPSSMVDCTKSPGQLFKEMADVRVREVLTSRSYVSLGSGESSGQASNEHHNASVNSASPSSSPYYSSRVGEESPARLRSKTPTEMASSQAMRSQRQCLLLCSKTGALADAAAEKMAEYLGLVAHPTQSLVRLANGLVDLSQIGTIIENGLRDSMRHGQALAPDMVRTLEKRFSVAQTDFRLVDRALVRELEYLTRGALGRMRRGFGRLFGDSDGFHRMAVSLDRAKEDLKISAQVFLWRSDDGQLHDLAARMGCIGLEAVLKEAQLRRVSKDALLQASTGRPRAQHNEARRSDENNNASPAPEEIYTSPVHCTSNSLDFRSSQASPNPRAPSRLHVFSEDGVTLGSHGSAPSTGKAISHTETPKMDLMQATSPSPRPSSNLGFYPQYRERSLSVIQRQQSICESGVFGQLPVVIVQEDSYRTSETERLVGGIAKLIDKGSTTERHLVNNETAVPRRAPSHRRNGIAGNNIPETAELVATIEARDHKQIAQLLDQGAYPDPVEEYHPLNQALLTQDPDGIRMLLLYGADPNAVDIHGEVPLLVATNAGFLLGAMLLLRFGADPNLLRAANMELPLAIAATANDTRMVHLLLMYGSAPNALTVDGNTALIGAINSKTPLQLIELLLLYGANTNAKNHQGKTALFEAIQAGRADIVKSLIDKGGANSNLPGPKHMLWPAVFQPDCLQVLLDHGADHKKTPGIMELASSINSIESVRILARAGVDPNAKKDGVYTPLCTSIRDNRTNIFGFLLAHGADPNIAASEYPAFKCVTHHRQHLLPALLAAGVNLHNPRGILETAVSSDNMEALRWLLDQGMSPDERCPRGGGTALTSAIRDNRIDFVRVLLARGANPNVRGHDWPVCMAVRHPKILQCLLATMTDARAFKGVVEMAVVADQLDSVKLLLAAGVSVEDRNGGVFSPLTTAIRERNVPIVRYLVEEGGADVNAPGEHLPIVKALRRCHDDRVEVVDMLLDAGADPNKVYRGWNGIMQALENGDLAMLDKVCRRHGVDTHAMDELGRTAVDVAVSRRWFEAVDVLMHYARRA